MIDYQRLKTDLLALSLFAVVLFMGLALFSFDPTDPPSAMVYPQRAETLNLCGPSGAVLASALINAFGLGSWFVLFGLVLVDCGLFSRNPIRDPLLRLMGVAAMLIAICLLLQIITPRLPPSPLIGSGGYLGAWGRVLLTENFSTVGSVVIVSTFFLVGLMLATETLFFRLIYRSLTLPFVVLLWPFYGRRKAPAVLPVVAVPAATTVAVRVEREAVPEIQPELPVVAAAPVAPVAKKAAPASSEFKVNPPLVPKPVSKPILNLFRKPDPVPDTVVGLPSLEMLDEAEEFPFELLAKKAQITAATLEKTFDEFGLNVKVSEIDTGPVVTQFELDLEKGLRVSKVVNLQDDLAIALRVPAIRVVSPIPGKNTVGVEVPNEKQVTVRLKELIAACREKSQEMRIPIFLGKDVSGRPLVVDLAKMPHLLIAGRTGTGKSVCLNTLIASILMTRSPDDVRMLMIDPKMVELSPYTKIPHLMNPVITDMKKAEAVLAWAVDKMEERYDLLAKVGVRHLDNFNKLGKEKVLERLEIDPDSDEADLVPERMPYIVIIADEMADLMMTSGKEVESHIIRLAQKSRAVGIHLVLATQKPTVDVITGLIKSNLPARISFQVASRVDSRVVLDEMGAERLLGNGDMLYLAPGTSSLTRAQGTYISDEEVSSIIEFYSRFPTRYSAEIEQATKAAAQAGTGGGDGPRERDDMYPQAVEVVIREGRGSCSLLQRALGVGYGRAARMIDHMAEDGIVGDYKGSKSREVVMTLDQWEERQDSEFANA
ncbi:DNA translocase FtsK [Planctomicrobium piriforme]|uniref:DNA segregation ATPase FtsK/SpoIIIE, S-DNA-T family n=1 Tax=Planctomicrobium piriforme TaxID=1576369 RepID=A0A1I3MUE7_9PLAN|nr:DNA translocase FtsK [Planctomicrobium piriforme]SFJ00643.1 DNA segregation ATPase FtsK/SpoIIIE, S-DNA-T family [Planctomicrobium piriforme]